MNNLIKTIEQLPVSKSGIETIAQQIVENIKNGDADPLKAFVAIKAMGELCKSLEKDDQLKNIVIDAAGNGADVCGAKISKRQSCTYDYTCSIEWCNIDSEIAKLTDRRKQIETALKNASDLSPFVDPCNFKKITQCPKNSEKTTISVTLKK